jgi:DNA-binding HxlR family transcriptional regulator
MPNKPWRLPDAAGIEWTILDLLLERPGLWRVEELVDVIDSPTAVVDALEALQATGLIERIGVYVHIAAKHR